MSTQGVAGKARGAMICPRCQGLMACEPAAEIDPDTLRWRRDNWRCVLCGNYRDPMIDRNRACQHALEDRHL